MKVCLFVSFLFAFSQTNAMEPETSKVNPQKQSALCSVTNDIYIPLFLTLKNQDRAHLLSTCRKLNRYGLEEFYPKVHPYLKNINWHKLEFPSPQEKIRFNQLVFFAVQRFHQLPFEAPPMDIDDAINILKEYKTQRKASLKSEEIPTLKENLKKIQNEKINLIQTDRTNVLRNLAQAALDASSSYTSNIKQAYSTLKKHELGLNLLILAEHIIEKVEQAGTTFNKNNPSKLFEKIKDKFLDIEHPLIPLFRWISQCAVGKVIVEHSYLRYGRPPITIDHELPIVEMAQEVRNLLIKYRNLVKILFQTCDPGISGEYNLHVLLFNKWKALYGFDDYQKRKNCPQNNYKITDGTGFMSVIGFIAIDFPHLPNESLKQHAHPDFYRYLMDRKML